MRIAVFSTKSYDEQFLKEANEGHGHELTFFEPRLTKATASLAEGHDCICAFVNDDLSAPVLFALNRSGVKLIALRSAGFNNVEVETAHELSIPIVRVPSYSPYAVAEHAVGLLLSLNRKLPRAYMRVRDGNFSLDGLLGFDIHGRTVGVVGTGRIGIVFAQIMKGFGCDILAYDPFPNDHMKKIGKYVDLPELFEKSDIVSLHCPLTPETYHLIDRGALYKMKKGAMLINTSRGALVDTVAVTEALKDGQLGSLALDVYEEEADLFFEDLSSTLIQDDAFARLLTFPNVLITGHQAFFTDTALRNIASTTIENISLFEKENETPNAVTLDLIRS